MYVLQVTSRDPTQDLADGVPFHVEEDDAGLERVPQLHQGRQLERRHEWLAPAVSPVLQVLLEADPSAVGDGKDEVWRVELKNSTELTRIVNL